MKQLLIVLCGLFVLASSSSAQEQQAPHRLTPEELKIVKENEAMMQRTAREAANTPQPKYNVYQCRADAQAWTTDGSDLTNGTNLLGSTAIMVNGQIRTVPLGGTPHVTMTGLVYRIAEMSSCQTIDEAFQKQFNTYAMLQSMYEEERLTRYTLFLYKHNLMDQFSREDKEEHK